MEKEFNVNVIQKFSGGLTRHSNQEKRNPFGFQVLKLLPNYVKLIFLNMLIQTTSVETLKKFKYEM